MEITQIEPEGLNKILGHLELKGLISVQTKKGFFGPKIEIVTTKRGDQEVERGFEKLEKNWGQMVILWKSKDKQKLQRYLEDNRSFFPMMMFFGIMDFMMFSTMVSFMGSHMTDYVPQEQIPQDLGNSADVEGMDNGGYDFDIEF